MVWNPNSGTMSRSSWGSGGKTFHPGLPGAKFTLGRGWGFVWQCSDLWLFSDQTDVVGPPGALEEAHNSPRIWLLLEACSTLQAELQRPKRSTWPWTRLPLSISLTPRGCSAGWQLDGWASGPAFRLPEPPKLSSLFMNPLMKALIFNETWEGWML